MKKAEFRFYAELNDFLPEGKRQVGFTYAFEGRPAIKDAIEALGVPHTEVDLILVNGRTVGFSYHLRDGDWVSVYPLFETLDVSPLVRVRSRPLREVRFVLDIHLGQLAAYLRMLGFDALYQNDSEDQDLARISSQEGRVLLTKDRGLLKRSVVTHGYFVREVNPREQLVEVLRRFDLFGAADPFRRCMRCNGLLAPVPKDRILALLPPRTRRAHHEFRRCQACGKVYWKGSHVERMERFILSVLREGSGQQGHPGHGGT
jgi:uncharacterized protein with PIN domain